ncbi:MAG: outer membrane lipoprotein carrier protein LolA [Spirochaetaceae bacterium]|jgi:outer membrane lipoprotein-sorting protein|nr:outer membrane lipoprotein carrier protein LolA [Spirochaetaceae bacterium]
MIHRSIFLFFLASWGLLYAQTEDDAIFRTPLTSETRPGFVKICADLSGKPIIKGNFEQTKTIGRLNRSLTSKGAFIIAGDQGMVWETLSPFPSTLVMGKNYMIQMNASGAKTKIDAAGNATFIRTAEALAAVFAGNSRKLAEAFEIYFTESGGTWTLGLIPSDSSMRVIASRIAMTGDSVIRTVALYEQNGDGVRYVFSNYTFPETLNQSEKKLFSL